MVSGECDPGENNRRRPREYGQPNESEDEISDISDDDDDEYSGGEEDSDDEIEIPDDPAHEARMQILRLENAALREQSRQQEQILASMQDRTEQMRYRNEQIKAEVARLKNLARERGSGATSAEGANGCKQYRETNNDEKKRGGDDEDQDQSGASVAQSKLC